jgi:uncharacterized membrane protein (DUF2068 family)
MHLRRTLKFLAGLLAAYALIVILAFWGPSSLQEFTSYFVLVPFLSIYLFHRLGIPGLLEHNGACGWGWCSPTAFGWLLLAVFWFAVAWAIAWALARLTARSNTHAQ